MNLTEIKLLNYIFDNEVNNVDLISREKIYNKIYDEIKEKYQNYKINIILDLDISD